jgi:hypothetical protein
MNFQEYLAEATGPGPRESHRLAVKSREEEKRYKNNPLRMLLLKLERDLPSFTSKLNAKENSVEAKSNKTGSLSFKVFYNKENELPFEVMINGAKTGRKWLKPNLVMSYINGELLKEAKKKALQTARKRDNAKVKPVTEAANETYAEKLRKMTDAQLDKEIRLWELSTDGRLPPQYDEVMKEKDRRRNLKK